jgi:hypothetical protein
VTNLKVAIGIAKCPTSGRIYGVRVEERDSKWAATWAFPIKPEVAKRERYSINQFPPDIIYDKAYPGCPFCKKHEDLAAITKPQVKKALKICVTSPRYDNIGHILDSLKTKYRPFNEIGYDCDVMFLNCGSADFIDPNQLEAFVKKGGCLYASDHVADNLSAAFPRQFKFDGRIGTAMKMPADVIDGELMEIAGKKVLIEFNLSSWVVLNNSEGETLLRASSENTFEYAGKPIMVKVKYGKGLIFYTSFHNYAQASEREKALLQLMVLRQFGENSNTSLRNTGANYGVDLDEIKSKFNFNW